MDTFSFIWPQCHVGGRWTCGVISKETVKKTPNVFVAMNLLKAEVKTTKMQCLLDKVHRLPTTYKSERLVFFLNYFLRAAEHNNFIFSTVIVKYFLNLGPAFQNLSCASDPSFFLVAKALRREGSRHCSPVDFCENMYDPVKSYLIFYSRSVHVRLTFVKMIQF